MNHCITPGCGRKINAGRTAFDRKRNTRCELCLTIERLRGWRYVSPAMKRWQKKQRKAV